MPTNDASTGRSPELERLLTLVRRRGWVVVLCALIGAGAGYALSHSKPREYTAWSSLVFRNASVAQQASGIPVASQNDPQGQRETNLHLVQQTDGLAEATAQRVGSGVTADGVRGAVAATGEGQSNVITVQVTWRDPVLAARIANTYVKSFITLKTRSDQAAVDDAVAFVSGQYRLLSRDDRDGAAGQALIDRIEDLRILKSMQGTTQVVQAAQPPTSPSSPKVRRDTVIGGVLGLLVGVSLVLLIDRLDRRLRDPKAIEDALQLPVLGVVPRQTPADPSAMDGKVAAYLEPFRMLRAHLRYFNVRRDLRTLVVASAEPAEGKTTTAWSLALAAASMGTRTLLVEADLRRPRLRQVFALEPGPGLVGLLINPMTRDEAIQTVPIPGQTHDDFERGLDVLPAGASPPNPAELLESPAMRGFLAWAAEAYELVIIDTAPISVVADAIPLMKQVSGVVVVSRVGHSHKDSTQRLRETLASLGAPVLGVVINAVPNPSGTYYGYASAKDYTTVPPSSRTPA